MQTIAMHILINISRSEDNLVMKFGHLTECSMRHISLEKSYTKCDGETILKLFLTLITLDFLKLVFTVGRAQLEKKAFLKNKKRFGPSLPASFSA